MLTTAQESTMRDIVNFDLVTHYSILTEARRHTINEYLIHQYGTGLVQYENMRRKRKNIILLLYRPLYMYITFYCFPFSSPRAVHHGLMISFHGINELFSRRINCSIEDNAKIGRFRYNFERCVVSLKFKFI